MRFYQCEKCGKIVAVIKDSKCEMLQCCGQPMQLMATNVEGAMEKHTPVIQQNGNIVTVKISDVAHPMMEEHHIEWIVLETENGCQRKELKAGDEPKADFALLDGEKIICAYAYCNLHGLWK